MPPKIKLFSAFFPSNSETGIVDIGVVCGIITAHCIIPDFFLTLINFCICLLLITTEPALQVNCL
jgi:hypothetical protein